MSQTRVKLTLCILYLQNYLKFQKYSEENNSGIMQI